MKIKSKLLQELNVIRVTKLIHYISFYISLLGIYRSIKLKAPPQLIRSKTKEDDLTEKKYLSIIDAKTAELFRISCFLPTIITNQDKKTQKIFNDFGFNFGMAFQLSDDVLDYFGDSGKMGKSVGKDFFEGKVTYLSLIHI